MDYETFPVTIEGPPLDAALTEAWQSLSVFGLPTPRKADAPVFFRSLGGMVTALGATGASDTVADIMRHVDYLAEKAGCPSAALLAGGAIETDRQYVLDALANIAAVVRQGLRRPEEAPTEGLPPAVHALILEAEARLPGWCTREKAVLIAAAVLAERPMVSVEIGVFGGRSLVPCAAALKHLGAGAVYGIEAWSPGIAVENPTSAANDDWWSTVDFARVKHDFYRFVADHDLTGQVRVIEAPSGRAAPLFDSIDFLHIDGSHSVVNAAEDVILYVRKVRPGGTVIFDDVNWQSTAPARALLDALCDPVTVLTDADSGQDMCAVLRRR
jgi:predicted O-methyltransferase YrrM